MAAIAPSTVALIAGGIQAAGSLVSGFSQSAQASREAEIADANARIAEQQAQSDAAAIRNKAIRLHGQQQAAIGASGIAPSGFMDALSDSDIEAELDAQNTLYNGRLQERNYRSQASAARSSGRASIASGLFGAGTSALSAYGNWNYLDTIDSRKKPPSPRFNDGTADISRFIELV
mgnify:CR=1 FL=1